jgi:hypothetical protein
MKENRDNESEIESPAWHEDVLREREEAVKSGRETFLDWEEVKKQLRKTLGQTPT